MKIILSRKGFDSQFGKIKSPILPDGTLLSLPIPQKNDKITYDQLRYDRKSYLEIIKDLNPKWEYPDNQPAHLDPDLRKDAKQRASGWKSIFGQSGAAQGHLRNQKINVGDIFLFFGSFSQTIEKNGKLFFKKDDKYPNGAHIIFGYLQIGQIIELNEPEDYEKKLDNSTIYHPHADKEYRDEQGYERKNNCMYVAAETLSLNSNFPGAGTLNLNDRRILTKPINSKILSEKENTISMWRVPHFFKNLDISYNKDSFKDNGYFKSAPRGQEFVINTKEDEKLQEKLEEWVKDIIIND
jgi:hypothetical protein